MTNSITSPSLIYITVFVQLAHLQYNVNTCKYKKLKLYFLPKSEQNNLTVQLKIYDTFLDYQNGYYTEWSNEPILLNVTQ